MGSEADHIPDEERERLSDQSWNHHRKRQLKELGVNPDDIDV